MVAEVGWEAAWRTLLDRALTSSAGRRQEGGGRPHGACRRDHSSGRRGRGGRHPRPRLPHAGSPAGDGRVLLTPLRKAGLGLTRAREVGWNVMLPLLVALAAAYNDVALARAAHTVVEAWPAPAPYGRTRALASLVAATPRDALTAQGLLRVQDLWCTRGGCGRCPLSPAEAPPATAGPCA